MGIFRTEFLWPAYIWQFSLEARDISLGKTSEKFHRVHLKLRSWSNHMICLMVIILNRGGGGGKERKGKTELSYNPPLPKVTKLDFSQQYQNVFSSQKVRRSNKTSTRRHSWSQIFDPSLKEMLANTDENGYFNLERDRLKKGSG